jgi:FKBP-type peptidyl-prolyl cis-trans isomerase
MATPKAQRIGIWVIAIVMAIGAVGTYFVVIMANNNDQAAYDKQQKDISQLLEEQQNLRAASSKPLEGYTAEAFDAGAVTELQVTDLVVGEGEELTPTSTIEANYFGWTADGKIFDSTNQNGTVSPATFGLQEVISGWTEGLTGARVGSVRKLVIPTHMAYGDNAAAQGRPSGPLAFIVEVKAVK